MMRTDLRKKVVLLATILLVVVVWVNAGNLNPPPGPVSSTMKSLDVVEPRIPISSLPYTIASPGSYYVTKDLTGVSGSNGITISAGGVSLDLSGFTLRGVPGSLEGIRVTGSQTKIHIHDGILCDWGGGGLNTQSAGKVTVQMMMMRGNNYGCCTNDETTVSYMMANNNATDGIVMGSKGICQNSEACGNMGKGISMGSNGLIENCHANSNSSDGISTGDSCTIRGCTTVANGGNGLAAGSGCTVALCTSTGNDIDGIDVAAGCLVRDCTTRGNANDGIESGGDCQILTNASSANGPGMADGAGIHVVGPGGGTRVEANNLAGNDRGIDVDSTGNVIIKNTATGGVPYSIVAGNTVGAITSAVGDGSFASANCWANLVY